MNQRPAVIDLFAGAGGFGHGFSMAGFDVQFSLEIDAWASETLRFNNPHMKVWTGDITKLRNASGLREVCPFSPDVIIGGPPCQGFSIAGPARKDPNDPRNSLFMDFAFWVKELRPRAFVLENVKGLLARRNTHGESVIEIIRRVFGQLDYRVEVWLLNAARYGVPQIRERIFVVGHDLENEIGPPHETHALAADSELNLQNELFTASSLRLPVTLWEAISDLPELEAGEGEEEQPYGLPATTEYQKWIRQNSPCIFNHVAMSHSTRLVERFKHIKCGESSSDVPEEHGARMRNGGGQLSAKSYDQNNRRLHPNRPSHTVAASFYANFVHPYQHRNLTAREGARLQSFPDVYRFMGKKTVISHRLLQREQRLDEKFLCQYNQIGNAVPPLLAKAVAEHLKERLKLCSCTDQIYSRRKVTQQSTRMRLVNSC